MLNGNILRSNRRLVLVIVLAVSLVYGIGYVVDKLLAVRIQSSSSYLRDTISTEVFATRSGSKSSCLRDAFSGIVLVIVYNYAFYSSIPTLTALYKNAFPTIMFCGPQKTWNYTVEALVVKRGFFVYKCMSRAMEKYPGYAGYLQISDDVLLNYWNLAGIDRDKIWVFSRYSIRIKNWFWWTSKYGVKTCQRALNEIWTLRKSFENEWLLNMTSTSVNKEDHSLDPLRGINGSVDLFKRSENWALLCDRRRSDIFYIPGKFAAAYKKLSHIFHKHRTFLEIAIPTMCQILDKAENFEYIPGVYLPGYSRDRESLNFWKTYDKTRLVFIHPFKLSYRHDGALNKEILRSWILDYSDSLSKC
ncbi:probable glycosyltransferase STELLO1 [Stylophora pistillata]|uniref:probable glycosyltransferase STELLO1 n=1 Tax=Stylophora pistillata TaxID=50429 RepID=UPI000C055AC2|nr:probable glycosyltransferase STELLO1 [Stylophora pistillata]